MDYIIEVLRLEIRVCEFPFDAGSSFDVPSVALMHSVVNFSVDIYSGIAVAWHFAKFVHVEAASL